MTIRTVNQSPRHSSCSASAQILRTLVTKSSTSRRPAASIRLAVLARQQANQNVAGLGRADLAVTQIENVCATINSMSAVSFTRPAVEQANTSPHIQAAKLLRGIKAEAKKTLATQQDIEKALRGLQIAALIQAAGRGR
ncbi:hypothetical protein ACFSM5_01055 [Lacibacterium aquatile]|uniref:Flagellin C-terminal domain-containing protein n=1 Tax=Lacibacterium aquatile TaxID=1168082 RepID=A0ABW5DL36_9PROT